LARGASAVPAVIRALDEAGMHVESLELHNPTLDDVFQAATGRRLEGADHADEASVS
jgi:ABC-2 type transport system ATP-binding protein